MRLERNAVRRQGITTKPKGDTVTTLAIVAFVLFLVLQARRIGRSI